MVKNHTLSSQPGLKVRMNFILFINTQQVFIEVHGKCSKLYYKIPLENKGDSKIYTAEGIYGLIKGIHSSKTSSGFSHSLSWNSLFCFFGFFKIYFWLVWALSSCSEQGLLFVAVHGLLITVASLVVEHRL